MEIEAGTTIIKSEEPIDVSEFANEVAKIDATKVDKKTYNKLLMGGGKVFKIIFIVCFALGLVTLFDGGVLVFTIPSLIFGYFGFKNLFIKKEAKDNFVKSKLIEQICDEWIQSGKVLREDANLIRIKYDSLFRKNAVDIYKEHISSLVNSRKKEINRIEKARWTVVLRNKFSYNMTEGKVSVNNNVYFFSDIKGASIVKTESQRVETKEKSVSKKKGSVGGAIAGGLVMGGTGALVGGVALGKTKTTTTGTSDIIPTCVHLGVMIDINNFQHEIILSNELIDQTSNKYLSLLKESENIMQSIQRISATPVPDSYLLPEQEESVLEIDAKIADAQRELELIQAELSV